MDTEVVVVGAGPVGLFLGARLAQLGVDVHLLDQRSGPIAVAESRAIGIHPPSLERLAALGVVEPFLAEGVKVRRGHARSSRGHLGTVELSRRPGPYPFVLTLMQARSEMLLSDIVSCRSEATVHRGVRVRDVEDTGSAAEVATEDGRTVRARFVVGCDGKASIVRAAMGAAFEGNVQPESYAMADLLDQTSLGSDAAIFLADEGLVESFPLPGGRRRWVVECGAEASESAAEIARVVARRTGERADLATATMLSSFRVEQRLASRFAWGRLVVCGDAAHVVSPFGGQGMNLGWLDAWHLAETLRGILRGHESAARSLLAGYERGRRRAAVRALRRAAVNRRAGHRSAHPRARNGIVRAVLVTVPDPVLARMFTMHGLE